VVRHSCGCAEASGGVGTQRPLFVLWQLLHQRFHFIKLALVHAVLLVGTSGAHRSHSSSAEEGRDEQLWGGEKYACSQVDGQMTSDHVEYNPQWLHCNQVTTSIKWHWRSPETCDGGAVQHTYGGHGYNCSVHPCLIADSCFKW